MSRKTKNGRDESLGTFKGYDYGFTYKERWFYLFLGVLQLTILGYIFYKSLFMIGVLQFLLPFYLKIKEEECRQNHMNHLKAEFKEMLEVYQGFIMAGYAADNAIVHTRKELISLGYEKSMVVRELDYMIRKLKLNLPLGDLFMDWGKRSGLRDIEDFASIFALSSRTGGDMPKIMRNCAAIIGEKLEVERDISTLLSARRYEEKVINIIPLFILLYVDITSKGFLMPLYTGLFGRGIMTLCLLVYFISFRLSQRIMNIEV